MLMGVQEQRNEFTTPILIVHALTLRYAYDIGCNNVGKPISQMPNTYIDPLIGCKHEY